MKIINLTPKEAEIINHRLEVADCIAEVWGPYNDNVWNVADDEDIQDRVDALITRTVSHKPNGGIIITFDPDDEDQTRLLEEVIEGNTMRVIVQDMVEFETGDPVRREGDMWLRHMRNLDKKFEAAGLEGFGL